MSRKMIIIVGFSIACLVINITNVEETKAGTFGSTSTSVVIVPDEVYSTAVSVNEAPADRTVPVAANAQLGHVAKPLPVNR